MTERPKEKNGSELTLRAEIPADRHPVAVFLARLAPGSRRTMLAALDTIARHLTNGRADAKGLDWLQLRYQHTAAVRSFLADKYAPATSNKILAALRGVLKETWRLGFVSAEEYHRAVDLPTVKGESPAAGRSLSAGELAGLFRVCAEDSSPAGARDAAVIALLYGAGLRRSELVSLNVSDYNTKSAALKVMRGKGRRARVVYAENGSEDALRDWLRVRGEKPGPLLVPVNKAGKIEIRRLSTTSIYLALARRAEEAGVSHFSPHDLRRTFVGDLLDSGADISTVRQLAGHAQLSTTARYDRRPEDTKRRAARLLHVPYKSPERRRRT